MTDAVGTSVTESFTLIENTPLVAAASAPGILCNGGTTVISTSASGGTYPYNGVTSTISGPGTFNYLLSDANGCRSSTIASLPTPLAC